MARRGFTLIELLVVIAIIAILAAILFPVLTNAKEAARKAQCLENMRQIGMAITHYVDDNNGKYPQPYPLPGDWDTSPQGYYLINDGSRLGYKWSWMDAVYTYVKNRAVMHCPSSPARAGTVSSNYRLEWSYVMTNYLDKNGVAQSIRVGIRRPTRTILISQGTYGYYAYNNLAQYEWLRSVKYYGRRDDFKCHYYTWNHDRGTNMLFADGHARWFSVDDDTVLDGFKW